MKIARNQAILAFSRPEQARLTTSLAAPESLRSKGEKHGSNGGGRMYNGPWSGSDIGNPG